MATARWKLWTLWTVIGVCIALVIWNTATLGIYKSAHLNVPLFLVISLAGILRRRLVT